jgi:hypothetical protein
MFTPDQVPGVTGVLQFPEINILDEKNQEPCSRFSFARSLTTYPLRAGDTLADGNEHPGKVLGRPAAMPYVIPMQWLAEMSYMMVTFAFGAAFLRSGPRKHPQLSQHVFVYDRRLPI